MSEKRKYRQFTPEQKAEIVLAGLRGDRGVRDAPLGTRTTGAGAPTEGHPL